MQPAVVRKVRKRVKSNKSEKRPRLVAGKDDLDDAILETVWATMRAIRTLAGGTAEDDESERIDPDHARLILEHAPKVLAEFRQLRHQETRASGALKAVRERVE
jgi:hypothetical protein